MTTNMMDSVVKNSFVDKCMKMIPEDPLTQSQYVYYLTSIVFIGLLGFALSSWYAFFITFTAKNFFSGLFMTAISVLSLFGLKQTRTSYLAIKEVYKMRPKTQETQENITLTTETKEEMMNEFTK